MTAANNSLATIAIVSTLFGLILIIVLMGVAIRALKEGSTDGVADIVIVSMIGITALIVCLIAIGVLSTI